MNKLIASLAAAAVFSASATFAVDGPVVSAPTFAVPPAPATGTQMDSPVKADQAPPAEMAAPGKSDKTPDASPKKHSGKKHSHKKHSGKKHTGKKHSGKKHLSKKHSGKKHHHEKKEPAAAAD